MRDLSKAGLPIAAVLGLAGALGVAVMRWQADRSTLYATNELARKNADEIEGLKRADTGHSLSAAELRGMIQRLQVHITTNEQRHAERQAEQTRLLERIDRAVQER